MIICPGAFLGSARRSPLKTTGQGQSNTGANTGCSSWRGWSGGGHLGSPETQEGCRQGCEAPEKTDLGFLTGKSGLAAKGSRG